MATVRIKFRGSSVGMKEGALFFQVIHNRIVKLIKTSCRVYPYEWDSERMEVVVPSSVGESRRNYLLSIKSVLSEGMSNLKAVIAMLGRAEDGYTVDRIAELYFNRIAIKEGFISFSRQLIGELAMVGKKRMAETYTSSLNSFVRFYGVGDISFELLDSNVMVEYESYLKSTGVCQNTTSFYMRNLRAIYNRAVEKGVAMQRSPFRHVYTGVAKTVKRAVPLQVIRLIKEIQLPSNQKMDYARDMFMFSFYTRGMSFVDMAYLRKKDLHNGILSYRRRKTGQQLFIKWEKPMQDIIAKYDTSGSPYLLPIIKDAKTDGIKQYRSAAHLVNEKLKQLGKQLGLHVPLTSYVARHAWASIAKSKNIPVATISEAMGHDSEKTTRIYLASLDTSVIDRANRLILKLL